MRQNKFKKIISLYKKLLKAWTKNKLNFSNSLNYFVSNLRLLRDLRILELPIDKLETDLLLSSLCITISEFNNYENCIYSYYNITNNNVSDVLEQKDKNLSREDVQKNYQTEKLMHLNLFWNMVKSNMEIWKDAYDY